MSDRFLIAAGGTGGHVFPALALARALEARGARPFVVTDSRGARFIGAETVSHVVRSASPSGGVAAKLHAILDLARGASQSWRLLGRSKAIAAASFGGYASFPATIAAWLHGVPILLHEQNAVFGRANRALARIAATVALSFRETERVPEGSFARIVTGNPVRPGFDQFAAERSVTDRILVLVLGGSQGARILSDALPGALALLPAPLRRRLRVVQQCRPEDLDGVRAAYHESGIEAELSTFFDDVPARMAAADLMVTRAGASTVAELTTAGCPAIVIPYLHAADNHQEANARRLADAGAAVLIRQPEVTIEGLGGLLAELLGDADRLAAMRQAMRGLATPDAAEQLAEALLLLARRRRTG